MVDKAAAMFDAGQPCGTEANMAKMLASEASWFAADTAIQTHGGAYLSAVGGAAYLVSQAVRAARVVAFADLGMEAIYEFEVRDMPVTVAIDARGRSVHAVIPIQAA